MGSRRTRASLAEEIDLALTGWRELSPEVARLQPQFEYANELAAIKQCIDLGVLDERGNLSPRTVDLIAEFHKRKIN